MNAREKHLQELKALQSRAEYFEILRQILDQLTEDFPVDRSLWMALSDIRDALLALEQGYRRVQLIKGDTT